MAGRVRAGGSMAGMIVQGVVVLVLFGAGEAGADLTSPAMDEDGTFEVSWSGIDCSRRCRLTQSRDGGAVEEVPNVGSSSHTVNLGASPVAGKYTYRIATCRALARLGGEVCLPFPLDGPWLTTTVVGAPAVPMTLTLTKGSMDGSYTLSWTASTSTGTINYRLYERKPNSDWKSIYAGTARTKSVTSEDMGTYYYKVQACKGEACSAFSNTEMIVVGMAEPDEQTSTVPGNLSYVAGVTRGGDGYVNIPVQGAPGVNGLMPRLSIDYGGGRERQRTNESLPGDILGYGWQVGGLSTIRRCVKNQASTAVVDLMDTDGLCLDGEPLVLVSGEHLKKGAEYRTLRESFVKITFKIEEEFDNGTPDFRTSWFEVLTPDGMKLEYGRTEDSRLRHILEGTANGIPFSVATFPYLWSVNKETDAFGNVMTYEYYEDELAAVRHPKSIVYGNSADAEIQFEYVGRTDLEAVQLDDFMQEQHLLLHGIRVKLDGINVRRYRLISETATSANWRRLNLVQLCAFDGMGRNETCLKPLDIDWAEPSETMPMVKTRVTKLTDPLGRETHFEYGKLTKSGTDAWRLRDGPFAAAGTVTDTEKLTDDAGMVKEVVKKIRRSNGLGGWRNTSYAYQGEGRRSTKHWGFLGFDAIRETDSATGVVTYRRYRMVFPHLGEEVEVREYDGDYGMSGTGVELLAAVKLTRAEKTLTYGNNATSTLPYVQYRTTFHHEDGTVLGATRTERTLTVSGDRSNPLVSRMNDVTQTASNVAGLTWPSPATVQRKTEVQTTFDNETAMGKWLIGFESGLRRKDYGRRSGSLTLDRTQLSMFTRHGDTNRVDEATRLKGDTRLESTTDLGYDGTGNLTSAMVSGCATCNVAARTEWARGFIDGRYPGTLENAVGHDQMLTYDSRFGLPKQVTDANDRVTRATYDAFGREATLTTPDGVAITTTYKWCSDSEVTCALVWGVSPVYLEQVTSSVSPTRSRYFDKLGRLVREEVQSFGSDTTWDRVDRRYDAQGLVRRVSEPYTAAATDRTDAPSDPAVCTHASSKPHRCVTYDNLGRPTEEARADGGLVTWTYNANASKSRIRVKRAETVKASDGSRVTTTLYTARDYDLTGELARLVEGDSDANPDGMLGSDGVSTEYVWYGSGLLKSVTVDGSYVTGFQYDAAGNRTRVTNPNFSTVTLRYTALGELYEREDSKGTTRWSYDTLSRVKKRVDADGVSEWVWDATNSLGSLSSRCRLDSAGVTECGSEPGFKETYTYGSDDARLDSAATVIRAGGLMKNYTRAYTHYGNGRLKTVGYPSGLTVLREYNPRGYLEVLKNKADTTKLVTYSEVNARGQAKKETYGNGTILTRMFKAESGRLESVLTKRGETEIRHDTYKWRSDGLLESRTDATGATERQERFVHDRLGRLESATTSLSGGGSRTLSMTYDKLGSLKSRSSSVTGDLDVSETVFGSGSSAPGPTAARTITVGSATHALSYDTGGRVKRDDDQSTGGVDRYFDWNARGLLEKVVAGDSLTDATPEAAEEYAYGPDGARYYRKSTWKDASDSENVTYPVEHRFYLGGFEERDDAREEYPKVRVETTRIGGAILHTRTTTVTQDPENSEKEKTTQVPSIRYLHRDHLGSVRAVTEDSGPAAATASYDPYGGRRLDDGTRESSDAELKAAAADRTLDGARGFTGHEQLDRIGLVHMGGRVYDPRLGRFLSPDPVIGNPGSSQSWNLYNYAGNSPMSFTDPTGLVRSSLPWENNTCGPDQGCVNLDGSGGGFGETTQRIDSYSPYFYAGVVTLLLPSWEFGWGLEGGWGFGYNVRSFAFVFGGQSPTSISASVPGDKNPAHKPINEVGGNQAFTNVGSVASSWLRNDERESRGKSQTQEFSDVCPRVVLQCRATNAGGVGYGPASTILDQVFGRDPSEHAKWGRYECTGQGGQCSFVGPGNGTNLHGVLERQVWQWKHGDFRPYPEQTINSFEVDPNSEWHRLKYGPEFFEALEGNLQDCKSAGLCE